MVERIQCKSGDYALKLCVVIPAYNEEKNLPVLLARLTPVLERVTDDHEVLFVNDGSRDATLQVLRELGERDHRVRYLSLSRNFGHEIAVAAGIDRAGERGADAVVLMDADLQDPPELIERMVERWRQGIKVIYAKRRSRRGDPLFKRAAIYVFYRLLGRISDIDIPLDTGNFRLMDKRVVEVVRSCRENPRFVRGLVPWAGFSQEALEFDRDPRHAGTTGYGFFKLAKLALDGICSFSQAPLRAATWMGGTVVGLSLLLTALVIVERLVYNGENIPRGFAFLACAIFFTGGVQLVMLGMLAQYVGYIFTNVQGRPLYVIAEQTSESHERPDVVVRAHSVRASHGQTPAELTRG